MPFLERVNKRSLCVSVVSGVCTAVTHVSYFLCTCGSMCVSCPPLLKDLALLHLVLFYYLCL